MERRLVAAAFAAFLTWTPVGEAKSTPHEFSYSQLKDLIVNHGIRSVDDLLIKNASLLPDAIRSRYLLVHTSGSLQQSSFDQPRIILFSDDAKFIMAVAGDASLTGGDMIEVIEFDDQSQTFQFSRVQFAGEDAAPIFEDGSDSPRPGVCSTCHGTAGRPNWATYDLWPTAYGATDDLIAPDTSEGQHFAAFLAKERGHGRYQALLGLPDAIGEGFQDYRDFYLLSTNPDIYSHINTDDYLGAADESGNYRDYPRANYKFTGEVSRINIARAAAAILHDPDLPHYKAGLLAAFDNAGDPAQAIDDRYKVPLTKTLDDYVADAKAQMQAYATATRDQTLALLGYKADACGRRAPAGVAAATQLAIDKSCDFAFFGVSDEATAGRLAYVFALVGKPFDMTDLSTAHGEPGFSFIFGNSRLEWLKEAVFGTAPSDSDPPRR